LHLATLIALSFRPEQNEEQSELFCVAEEPAVRRN